VARAPGPGLASSGDLVARADESMYAAKRSGRNRVCSAES
jgi:PleD family two-component response regulator